MLNAVAFGHRPYCVERFVFGPRFAERQRHRQANRRRYGLLDELFQAGRADVGQISSSPSLMLAASQDIPVRCIAVGFQEHPFCFYSLARNPVRTPQDLVGKRDGIQQTAIVLLRALLAKNNIAENQVRIVPIGADLTSLLTGQVDVATAWTVNVALIRALGDQAVALRLWDAGVRLYAKPYYAQPRAIETRADVLAKFLRATAKGHPAL